MLVFLKGAFNYTRALAQSVAVAGVLIAVAVAARYEQIRFALLEIADTYEQKSDVGGLNGREEIWGQAWDDACAFGYGSDYFQSRFELGGHNTIIDLLARLGYVTAGLAITVCLVTVLEAMRFWKQQTEDPYALLPALVVVCFWTLSMAEGMFGSLGNTVTMAFLVSTGIIVSSKRQVLATNSLVAAVTRNATAPRRRLDPGNSLSPGVSRRAVSARGRT